MLFSSFTSFLLGLLLFSTAVDTQTDETWELKFDNGGFQLSYAAMCAMLKRADLESKGFKKLVTTTEVQEEESGKSIFQTVYFYYKSVNCSYKAIQGVEEQLNTSLPGVFEKDLPVKVREAIKFSHLKNAGRCITGLEVHFMEGLGCDMRHRKRADKEKRRGGRIHVKFEIGSWKVEIDVNWKK